MPISPVVKPFAGRLRLKHLQLVQQIFERQTLRAAAEASNMTQSAATKLLQEVEGTYAVQLFQRSKYGMSPTSYGDVFRRHIGILLADLERMEQEITLVARGGFGRIRLGVLPSVPAALLNGAIRTTLAEYPGVRFSLYEANSNDLLGSLLRSEIDVAFARATDREMIEGMHAIRIYDEPFLIVCRPDHALTRVKHLSWKRLSEAAWLLPEQGTPIRNFINDCFSRNAALHPAAVVECTAMERVRSLVVQSDMIALMARSFVMQEETRRKIAVLNFSLGPNFVSTSLVMRHQRDRAPIVEAFCRVVQETASRLGLSQLGLSQ